MAKKKATTKETPKNPPQSVDEVLLNECVSRITPDMVRNYAMLMFREPGGKKAGTAEGKAEVNALLHFANLGWTYFHSKESADFKPASA